MSQYNYIKVSLYGQFGDGLKTAMRFPTAVEGGQPEAKMTVFNPTKVLDQFTNARECYAVWQTMTGCYYGLVTRNPLDPTTGAMLVTLMVPHGIILTGRQVMQALTALRKTLVEDGNYTDEAVIAALRGAGLPEHPAFFPELEQREKENRIPTEDGPKSTGYRTYANGHDLESILSFPYQTEYRFRRRILIVSATTVLKPESTKLQRVQTPLEREFWVECPTGVAATPICGAEGDKISLIFSKAGYTPSKQTITAGIPSPYTRIEGSLIKVKTPAESGLSFTRRIKLNIKSAKGGAVNGYTINVNSRSINSMEPVVELTEHDMTAGKKITIAVASNNFRPVKLEKTPEELASVETLDIVLEPLEQGITLHLDFGEGRVFEQHISIERNTPEYSQLHSGNFHGFRAHRISGLGINEAYNVDVRSASRPTAPTYVNETKTTTTTTNTDGPKAPVFENVSRDNTTSSGTIEKPNITNATTGTDNAGEETTGGFSLSKLKIKGSVIIGVVLGIIVLVAAIKFLPGLGGKSSEETTNDPNIITAENLQGGGNTATGTTTSDTPTATDTPAEETTTATPAEPTDSAPAASTPSADEVADIEYLNSNTKVWKVSALKSQKYRDLIDAIKRGDIQAMANSDYFAVEGRATNKYANEMMEMAWKSLGTANEKGNVNVLKKADGKDEIDVYGLYDALARVKPATPNETPRPKR